MSATKSKSSTNTKKPGVSSKVTSTSTKKTDVKAPRSISGRDILFGVLAVIIVLLGIFAFWPRNVPAAPAAVIPTIAIKTPVPAQPTALPVIQPAVQPQSVAQPTTVELITELRSDEKAAKGLSDQKVNPVVTLNPGEGVMISSDPGGFLVEGTSIDSESMGYMAYIWNNSQKTIDVVLHTGWNDPNKRWNIHPVVYKVLDVSALREHVLDINLGEKKPVVYGYIFADGKLSKDSDLNK